ncbi:MAG: hypothetical protein ACR2H5_10760 [Ktedonobacteraceae bacterium]
MNVDEQKKKDLDVEIVDLPGGGDEQQRGSERPFMPFPSSIKLTSVARQRRFQLILTASIVAIVVVIILGSSLPVRNLAVRLLAARVPTPTATLVPGVDLFYIDGAPSWGSAYLDGQRMKHLPNVGVDPPLRIARGQHVLEWKADPFQEQRCIVSVPANFGVDTCHYDNSVSLGGGRSAWLLSFPASLQIVPDKPRLALLQAVQAALDAQRSTETVQPGEVYDSTSQRGVFITARQPLRATIHFQLDASPLSPNSRPCTVDGQNNGQECVVWGQDCHVFCADPMADTTAVLRAQEWDVLGVVLPVWDYTTLNGKSIAQNQPDAFAGAQGYELVMPFHITWDEMGWHVSIPLGHANTLPFGNPFCSSAESEVQIDAFLSAAELKNFAVSWKYASGPLAAAGCVAVAAPNLTGLTITPAPSYHVAAYCLQRFGVLLAANDVAHRLWPTMPMADAYEQHLALQLVLSNGLVKG